MNFDQESKENKEDLWRKIILNKTLENMKFKALINELLDNLDLPR